MSPEGREEEVPKLFSPLVANTHICWVSRIPSLKQRTHARTHTCTHTTEKTTCEILPVGHQTELHRCRFGSSQLPSCVFWPVDQVLVVVRIRLLKQVGDTAQLHSLLVNDEMTKQLCGSGFGSD